MTRFPQRPNPTRYHISSREVAPLARDQRHDGQATESHMLSATGWVRTAEWLDDMQ